MVQFLLAWEYGFKEANQFSSRGMSSNLVTYCRGAAACCEGNSCSFCTEGGGIVELTILLRNGMFLSASWLVGLSWAPLFYDFFFYCSASGRLSSALAYGCILFGWSLLAYALLLSSIFFACLFVTGPSVLLLPFSFACLLLSANLNPRALLMLCLTLSYLS